MTEKRCGGPVYANNNGGICARLEAVECTAPGDSANCPGVWSHLYERFDND